MKVYVLHFVENDWHQPFGRVEGVMHSEFYRIGTLMWSVQFPLMLVEYKFEDIIFSLETVCH